jgi:hypothetical protein
MPQCRVAQLAAQADGTLLRVAPRWGANRVDVPVTPPADAGIPAFLSTCEPPLRAVEASPSALRPSRSGDRFLLVGPDTVTVLAAPASRHVQDKLAPPSTR